MSPGQSTNPSNTHPVSYSKRRPQVKAQIRSIYTSGTHAQAHTTQIGVGWIGMGWNGVAVGWSRVERGGVGWRGVGRMKEGSKNIDFR